MKEVNRCYKSSSKISKNKNVVYNYVANEGSIKILKSNKEHLHGDLICDEKNSFYLGRHIIRNGDRLQRYNRSPDPMCEFFHLNKEVFLEHEVDVDKAVIVNGCFKTNKETLQRTMIPEEESIFTGFPSMLLIKKKEKAIKTAIRKLKIQTLAKCVKSDMKMSCFNLKTYPGFTYSEYYNMKTKGEACEVAFKIACKRWDNINKAFLKGENVKRKDLFPNTYAVGARNKRDLTYESNEVITSRAVHMPEFHSEMNSAVWVDQITEAIKEKGRGCLYIGNSLVKYDRLYNDTHNSKSVIEGDVKRFDSSLYINDIIIAVALSRLYYDIDDKEIDQHFLAIFDTIGIKDYYTPGGFIYRMIHGLPSGVKSTSIFGSLINLVNLIHCCSDKDLKRTKFIVGGDDFLISSEEKLSSADLDKIENISINIGIRFKFLKIKDFTSSNIDDRPCFYKYTIDRGEPVTPTNVLLERIFIPWNENYNSNYKILKFLFDIIPSLGAPRSNSILFYKFFVQMYSTFTKRKISLVEIYKMHKGIYESIMRGALVLKRKDFSPPTPIYNLVFKISTSSKELPKIFFQRNKKDKKLVPSFIRKKVKISKL